MKSILSILLFRSLTNVQTNIAIDLFINADSSDNRNRVKNGHRKNAFIDLVELEQCSSQSSDQ